MNQILPEQDLFHAIYFIDEETGSVLVSNKYTNFSETNADLISGFLSAMNMFMRELKNDDEEEIREINFQHTRLLYERKGRLLCIGISKKEDLKLERKILVKTARDFYERFEDEITHFNGFIKPAILEYGSKMKHVQSDASRF